VNKSVSISPGVLGVESHV